jgi:glucosyl-dolichyl phosphate glucuronosyltransferase
MDISIIICTWNNSCRLAITLDAIRRCQLPSGLKWEVVVTNNASTDDTATHARRLATVMPLVYVEERQPGLSRAKNAALCVATGRLLIFADDDVTPCGNWISSYWTAYQARPSGYYFGGPLVSEYEGGAPPEDVLRVAGHSITGLDWGPVARTLSDAERVYPANWACPASALRAVGDFDPDLGLDSSLGYRRVGETFDIMDRLAARGLSAWYVPQARVVHFVPRSKCTITALGENAEAIGRYSARAARPHRFLIRRIALARWCQRRGLSIAGAPWRIYVKSAMLGARWIAGLTIGRKMLQDYVCLRFCLGMIKGYRASRRSRDAVPAVHRP